MQNTSAAYKMAITAKTRTIVVKGRIQTPAGAIYDLPPSDIVSGTLSIKSSIFDAGAEIGNTIASDVSVSVHNDTGVWSDLVIAGSALWLWSGVVLPDDTTEYVLLGTFVVEKVSRPNRILSITAADRLVLLDVPFSSVEIAFSTIGATLQEILDAVCSHCSVPLLSASWTGKLNMTHAVLSRPADDLSCRDVVGMIAAISGSNVRMTRDGYLERLPLIPIVSADIDLGTTDRFSFEQTSGAVSLTGITYTDTDGTVYSAGISGYTIALSSNPFILHSEQDLLDAIWAAIDGFSYAGFTLDYPGDPAIDVGDIILNTTRDDETVLSIVGTSTFTVGSTSTLSAPVISDTESGYLSGDAKRLSTIAAKAEQVKNDLSSYESKSAQIADLMTAGMGLYKYELQQEDGSVVIVYGNKSTLETSDIQWKMTAGAFSVSHDYGATWSAGITASGEMLVTVLTAVGVVANWIKTGRLESTDGDTYFDLDSGDISSMSRILMVGVPPDGEYAECITQIYQGLLQTRIATPAVEYPTPHGAMLNLYYYQFCNALDGGSFTDVVRIQSALRAPIGGGYVPLAIDISNTGVNASPDGTASAAGINDIPIRIWTPVDCRNPISCSVEPTLPGHLVTRSYADSDWTPVSEAWTYYTPSAVSVLPATALNTYQVLDKVRFVQDGSVKYGRVERVMSSTLLALIPSSQFPVTSSAISEVYLSRKATPFGFPKSREAWRQEPGYASNVWTGQLENGIFMNDDGTVRCDLFLTAINSYISNQQTLITLPTNYRPSRQQYGQGWYQRVASDITYLFADIIIQTNGIVKISCPINESQIQYVRTQLLFTI